MTMAFIALLMIVGISASATRASRSALAHEADSANIKQQAAADSQKINEGSVVDEVIWVVGDEAILKSDVEVTRLQAEAEGIKYTGDPDCSIPEQIAVQKLFLHQAAIDSIEVSESEVMNGIDEQINSWVSMIGSREKLEEILATVLDNLSVTVPLTVERVQDEVERTLMERGHYEVAKAYILYREKRSALRRVRHTIAQTVGDDSLDEVLRRIQMDFTEEVYSLAALQMKFESFCRPGMTEDERAEALTKAAVELTTAEAPKWEFIAARLLNHSFRCRNAQEWEGRGVGDLYGRLRYLTDKGLYGDYILAHYTHEEIAVAEGFLCPERDELFTYSGLDLLLKRYVIQTRSRVPLETPQEMFLGIALHLAMNEGSDRMGWVKRFYDMLSRMEVTMATPTMSNARKPYHQLSSCFVDTVPDSLDGIYRSLDNFAKVSKFGGGMGMYFGKVRAAGSTIRGFQGAAGGVIRWIRLVNDTAVAVDQLGMRQGAVAVYLDAWHRDLPEFLQLRTNNGDDRMKAHDVFPAVCYPDLFWRLAEENIDAPWHLMCPHEILTVKGYALEDYWGTEWEKRYLDCVNDPRIEKRSVTVKDIVRLSVQFLLYRAAAFVSAVSGVKPLERLLEQLGDAFALVLGMTAACAALLLAALLVSISMVVM